MSVHIDPARLPVFDLFNSAPIQSPMPWPDAPPVIMDSFAGGGGASTGIEMALGRSPDIAINHNPVALALHEANHPETLHLSENVYHVDPLDHVAGRHVGLAWFSPDCKHFSKAKGGKPVERNIRDLAWIIPGWVERIQQSGGAVDVVILENVEEFQEWGPLVETDRGLMPDPTKRGQTFRAWCKALKRLGGKVEWRELRACDYGAPTIRKRLFVIVRFDGQKIVWPKPTHGRPDDPAVVAGRKLPWRTAAEIIDWSIPCPSIFDTSEEVMAKLGLRAVRPLARATMARVARGVKRYVLDTSKPFIVRTNMASAAARNGVQDPDQPLNTIMTAGSFAAVTPSVIRFNTGATGHDVREPLATVTANSFLKKPGGAAPLGVLTPHLMTMRNAAKPFQGADEPTHTVTAGGAGLTLVAPVLSYGQQGGGNRSPEDPHHTITASAKDQNSVVVPTLVGCGGRAGQSRPSGVDEPAATITAKADVCVAAAFMAQHNNDARREGGVNPGRLVDEPLSTITSTPQQGVISAFMSRQFGTSVGHGLDEPAHTATAGVNKSAVVTPFLQKYYGTGDGARLDEPSRTVTVKDRFGFVEGELGWPPFTEAMKARAREVAAFLREHGFWDEREFVTVEIAHGDGVETLTMVDIGMRMLTPRELFNAQGFPPDYVIEFDYRGKPLPKSDQIACCGNSVCPPLAAALVAANCGYLSVVREAAE